MFASVRARFVKIAPRRHFASSPVRKRAPQRPAVEGLETRQLMAVNVADTVGVYRPANSSFYLRNSNTTGYSDVNLSFGKVGSVPLVGDWDGDGVATAGTYDPATARFQLRNSNSNGSPQIDFIYGPPGSKPLVGDWDGDGVDTVGVYRPGERAFYLRNTNTGGVADNAFSYGVGATGDVPLVGDWDGDGVDTVGVYRPDTAQFYLRNSNTAGRADLVFVYGDPGWTPIAGDWNGDGYDTVGAYVPSQAKFYLRNSNTQGYADLAFTYGNPNDKPLVGRWTEPQFPDGGNSDGGPYDITATLPSWVSTRVGTSVPLAEAARSGRVHWGSIHVVRYYTAPETRRIIRMLRDGSDGAAAIAIILGVTKASLPALVSGLLAIGYNRFANAFQDALDRSGGRGTRFDAGQRCLHIPYAPDPCWWAYWVKPR